jgi:hypothetical protein
MDTFCSSSIGDERYLLNCARLKRPLTITNHGNRYSLRNVVFENLKTVDKAQTKRRIYFYEHFNNQGYDQSCPKTYAIWPMKRGLVDLGQTKKQGYYVYLHTYLPACLPTYLPTYLPT